MRMFDPDYWARAHAQSAVLLGILIDRRACLCGHLLGLASGAASDALLDGEPCHRRDDSAADDLRIGREIWRHWLFGALFISAFFAVHYGMFCFVHGVFLTSFLTTFGATPVEPGFTPFDFGAMIAVGLQSGRHVDWMLGLIVGYQVFAFLYSFVLRGEWKYTGVTRR